MQELLPEVLNDPDAAVAARPRRGPRPSLTRRPCHYQGEVARVGRTQLAWEIARALQVKYPVVYRVLRQLLRDTALALVAGDDVQWTGVGTFRRRWHHPSRQWIIRFSPSRRLRLLMEELARAGIANSTSAPRVLGVPVVNRGRFQRGHAYRGPGRKYWQGPRGLSASRISRRRRGQAGRGTRRLLG